jgi:hypothetical protein
MPRSPAASHHAGMTIDQAAKTGGITAVLERPGARLEYEVAGDGPAIVLIQPATVSELLTDFAQENSSWSR